MQPTKAQLRILFAVEIVDPADGWGDIFTHYDKARGTPSSLEMRNFDRSSDACIKRGWLRVEDNEISLTDAGRKILLSMKAP